MVKRTEKRNLNLRLALTPSRIAACLALCLILSGCDPVARHKALTTIFDGVPSLPPPEELCREHVEKFKAGLLQKEQAGSAQQGGGAKGSLHPPYAEKRCNDCHTAEKEVGGGLVKPREELCFLCHTDILAKPWQHGPAAVGDCLACHLPHDSQYPSLLVMKREEICGKCHREPRLAKEMHARLSERGMACVDCHDPHAGNSGYFLK